MGTSIWSWDTIGNFNLELGYYWNFNLELKFYWELYSQCANKCPPNNFLCEQKCYAKIDFIKLKVKPNARVKQPSFRAQRGREAAERRCEGVKRSDIYGFDLIFMIYFTNTMALPET